LPPDVVSAPSLPVFKKILKTRRLPSKCNAVVTFLLHRCYAVCCLIYRCPFFCCPNFWLPFFRSYVDVAFFYATFFRCPIFPLPFLLLPNFPLPICPVAQFSVALFAFFPIAVFTFYHINMPWYDVTSSYPESLLQLFLPFYSAQCVTCGKQGAGERRMVYTDPRKH